MCGETPADERDRLIEAFKNPQSRLKYLVNVGVLTEGFDAPNVDCICLLRATKSPGLYYQMVGRGFRIYPEKKDCLVLDFGENVYRHGPIDQIQVRTGQRGRQQNGPLVRICPECQALVPIQYRSCDQCGYEFLPEASAKHSTDAAGFGIMSDEVEVRWVPVTDMWYSEHTKRGASDDHPKTLRVTYYTGLDSRFEEWICVEHTPGSYVHTKAWEWWSERSDKSMPPDALSAAQEGNLGNLRQPVAVHVRIPADRKAWPKILGYRWERQPGDDIVEDPPDPMTQPIHTPQGWEQLPIDEDDIPF